MYNCTLLYTIDAKITLFSRILKHLLQFRRTVPEKFENMLVPFCNIRGHLRSGRARRRGSAAQLAERPRVPQHGYVTVVHGPVLRVLPVRRMRSAFAFLFLDFFSFLRCVVSSNAKFAVFLVKETYLDGSLSGSILTARTQCITASTGWTSRTTGPASSGDRECRLPAGRLPAQLRTSASFLLRFSSGVFCFHFLLSQCVSGDGPIGFASTPAFLAELFK